ncbi:zinc finger BED domain-containing protein 4-like [Phyllobates terribilis]|uniref:zinc finger BED domain-containing protein 4-like n=1 Tax=Phyllobates terribilis TaxID=111132 RepID=UPI003CCB3813
MNTTKPTQRGSLAWHFFRICDDDKTRVVCTLCHQRLKRGINILSLSTTCMLRHLNAKHELQWSRHLKKLETSEAPPVPSSAAVSASSSCSQSTGSPGSPQRADATVSPPPPPAVSLSISTPSHGSVPLSIPQTLDKKRKYPTTHPRALVLNDSISKFLAFEMLPFRLVETDSFKKLMAVAVPKYVVPSRHYFSRRAIPVLHTNVVDKIRCALRNAVSGKVHITTDTWTSKHGGSRYISLTAHWVNVVAAGPEAEGVLAHVLPPPRIAGQLSVHVASYSDSSNACSFVQRNTCTTNFCTAMGKRQQAFLKLICLGDKSYTAQELWMGIKQQTDEWLLPLNLKPGLVMCDNGQNLVAALGLANLSHIPCLAHVLNLVVQGFLKNYPEMSELLQKVRAVCALFRRSHPAAARLSALQHHFSLPSHRLICDVPTKWNSTLQMLERLCEQQQAIVEFQLQRTQVSHFAEQHHFSTNEWASIRDVCAVLRCFEYSTNMASADDGIISVTIPLLCLLEKTLQAMIEEVVAEKEEVEEQGPFTLLSGESSTHGSEGGFLYQQLPGTQLSSQGTVLEDEEEDEEEEPSSQQGGTQNSSRASLERGWGDTEDPDDTPHTEDSFSLPLGSLAHMCQYMLLCLRNDCRVARIVTSADYWVAAILDPRYKDKVPSLLPLLERDCKMQEYKRTLVDALLTAFPLDNRVSVEEQGKGGSRQHSWGTGSTSEGRVSLAEMWKTFLSAPQHPAPLSDMVHISRSQRFNNMVEEYMSTHLHVLSDGSAPFNFWVSKLDTWPELALYALEVLDCPAASVLSEHMFSMIGGVRTDRRIRLSTANLDKLTFIKMNQAWIPEDLSVPLDD